MPFLADPVRRAEDERRQELRRASFSRARLTPEERMISRGSQMEEIAREHARNGGGELALHQLAHGLALQGKYEDAESATPDDAMKEHYAQIAEAINRADEMCACPRREVEDPLSKQTLSLSPRRHLEDVYSTKHGRVVALMKCEDCGVLNARPLTGQAREIARIGAAKKDDPRKLRDAQVLIAK
jgi:hypothetical protein